MTICPECARLGLKSCVNIIGGTSTMLGWLPLYYDEDGNAVRGKDPNKITTRFECSNGHKWTGVEE